MAGQAAWQGRRPGARDAVGHRRRTADDGTQYGLSNLAANLATIARDRWPEAVHQHARVMVQAQHSESSIALADVSDRIYLRLHHEDAYPARPEYGEPPLPGVVALVAIDHPDHVQSLLSLDGVGSWDEVRAAALENIRRLPPMTPHLTFADAENRRAPIHVFDTDDVFASSRFFVLDQLLGQIGVERPAHGVLLIVPSRHVLALHVLDGPDVVLAIRGLVNLGRGQHDGHAGAISPDVYYLAADGRTQQLTSLGEDGQTVVTIDGAIAEAFAALGLTSD